MGTAPSPPAPTQQFSGSVDCAVKILRSEGLSGLYKGLGVTALRELPSIGVYFTVYKLLREHVDRALGGGWETTSTIVSGGVAGCCSWFVVYPLDVIKTNIQVNGFVSTGAAGGAASDGGGGIFSTGSLIYRRQGLRGFFRGLGPTMMRAFPVNGITFLMYEKLKKLSGLHDAT